MPIWKKGWGRRMIRYIYLIAVMVASTSSRLVDLTEAKEIRKGREVFE